MDRGERDAGLARCGPSRANGPGRSRSKTAARQTGRQDGVRTKSMLDGKRIAILVEQDFEDSELTDPMGALKAAGARVMVVGSGSQKTYGGKRGTVEVRADADAGQVRADYFDAVVVPGGYAPDKMRMHRPMVELVKKMHDSGKIVAAICHGPQLLISAEVVRGRRVTSWPSVAVDLKNAGALWVNEAVVRDGNLITSRQPADIPEFNAAVIQALEQEPEEARLR